MKHDFHYISKHDPAVKKDYQDLIHLLNELQILLRDKFTFQYSIVGSYSRNMITYDTKSNVGYDFDFNIEINDYDQEYSADQIKKLIMNGLNKIVKKYDYSNAKDSTRVITIKKIDHKNSRILSSCDLCIVNNFEDDAENECQELIVFDKKTNHYIWNEQSEGYYMLPDKIDWLKENDLWQEVRDRYIKLKNENEDSNVHSRTLFANAVHQMCQKFGYYED